MKKTLTTLTAMLSVSLVANAQVIDFNGGSELANDFAGLDGTTPFTQSATGGLSNSGSITLNGTSQIAVYQTGFDASGLSGDTFGIYYQYNGADNNGRPGAVGFTSGASDTYSSSATTTGTDLRVLLNGDGANGTGGNNYGISIFNNNSQEAASSTNVTLTNGNWYFMELEIGGISGGSFTNVIARLYDSDTSGTLGTVLKELDGGTGGYTIASALTSDTNAYAFFGGQSPTTRGVSVADNLTVSAIPEPSSLALIGLGLAGLLMRRRR